jgi:hypothetical protein
MPSKKKRLLAGIGPDGKPYHVGDSLVLNYGNRGLCWLAAADRAVVTDELVQLRLIAHIEKRNHEVVGTSRLSAQSATLTMDVEAFVPETSKENRAATAKRVFALIAAPRDRDYAFERS